MSLKKWFSKIGWHWAIMLPLVFMVSCEKLTDGDGFSIGRYPFVFYELSDKVFEQMVSDYANNNPYLRSSINEFGFAAFSELYMHNTKMPEINYFTEMEAMEIAIDFVRRNKNFIGVDDPDKITFKAKKGEDQTFNYLLIHAENQFVDSLEIQGTTLSFSIKNGEVFLCWGRRFPGLSLPENVELDETRIKGMLVGRDASYLDFIGNWRHDKVTAKDLDGAKFKLLMKQFDFEDRIEVRLVWEVCVPDASCYIAYVDALTYQIISDGSAIIS
jgi:hypothetical protein